MNEGLVRFGCSDLPTGRRLATVTLTNAACSNSLTPEVLQGFTDCLGQVRAAWADYVLITAEGRNFSTGGDVRRFQQAVADGGGRDYADRLVGALQRLILDMVRLPAITIVAGQGAITGGSAGLVFAGDIVLLAENVFVQPYYSAVGFAPDGGWSALLPMLIGAKRALAIQLQNQRIQSQELVDLGLAEATVAVTDLAKAARERIAVLDTTADPGALLCAKALIWDQDRTAQLQRRLVAEQAAFLERITLSSTQAGMAGFLRGKAGADV